MIELYSKFVIGWFIWTMISPWIIYIRAYDKGREDGRNDNLMEKDAKTDR